MDDGALAIWGLAAWTLETVVLPWLDRWIAGYGEVSLAGLAPMAS